MKKYDVHVILGDKFHSVVIECDGIDMNHGAYIFYKTYKENQGSDRPKQEISYYPIDRTIIEEHKENNIPLGSAAWRS